MSNVENNVNSEQNTEKAEVLFDALQNVPEELLNRSEKSGMWMTRMMNFSGKLTGLMKQHKQICVACLSLIFVGLCFIAYQSFGGGMDSTTNTADVDMMVNSAGEAAGMEEAADAEEEAGIEDVADGMKETENMGSASGSEQTQDAHPEVSLEEGTVGDALEEAVTDMEKTKDLFAAYMPKQLPEGYAIKSVNISKGEQEEVLQLRLEQAEGQYIQLLIKRPVKAQDQGEAVNTQQNQKGDAEAELHGNVIAEADLTENAVKNARELIAGLADVNTFTVQYADGVSVECESTASNEDIYRILAAYAADEEE